MFTPGRVRSFTMQKRQECVVNHRHEEAVGRQEVSPGTRSFQFLGGVSARQTVPLCLCALAQLSGLKPLETQLILEVGRIGQDGVV